MAISLQQQVDFLWKKLGFNVAKTEVPSNKDATNESIPSSPFIPGDKIWTQSDLIPTVIPAVTTSIVEVHSDAASSAITCAMDITATSNRTWLTNLTDWVPTTFGSTYQIKVYLAPWGCPNPQTVGVQLYAAGTNNNDEWYFDHESGILNFIGDNLPAVDFSNKTLYVCGARYKGLKGVGALLSGTFGNITISGNTIASSSTINLAPVGNIYAGGGIIGNVGYPTLPSDAATVQYVLDSLGSVQSNAIHQGDTSIGINDSGVGGTVTVKVDGTITSTATVTTTTFNTIALSGSSISSTAGDLTLSAPAGAVITTPLITAMKLPTGATTDRPASPDIGLIRFNSTSGMVEVFDGASWVNTQAQISSQTLYGDGTTTTFTLDKSAYANNLLVVTNGVVQTPAIAYVTNGTTITFAEPPMSTDVIDIRFMSQSVTATTNVASTSVVDAAMIGIGTNSVILDMFNHLAYSAAKYIVQVTNNATQQTQLVEILLTHNGVNEAQLHVTQTSMTGSEPTLVSYSASVSSGTVVFSAVSSVSNVKVRLSKTYFTP
jgi:hypothetical protein